ncbi:UDP-4-amino-4,6-dideoxy-N-acetyl-beta-L-altrosamine transaminase [Shewanella dokdonensis]|uniref:UDP-4-amino-4, 6-dideoxy-N-acetyl-beta-L-altrosamine transaminase n=1 Tax=Shewanella dokdonensis TaxID=712036 RepID=A0ABX8DGA1_9GAMM|nr:UDP-4-amino-4,6-dideoxy-N-acetyl-beta-L-altrosamine transaminase [Shewanella dokdonensis]MCL1073989.1 UDP-4-amino-4,6-dideoxy-N-acetyl-beta-L-altrosamine transaminase [Shewanella dokdonensis]QVK23748.1 UDP-4-amino-4,6-dideoxy-N-acetyl-beta-L-altrosamine transaminase [Shewanella dokdonensis]
MIPYGRQAINQTDIDAVVEVLKSDYLTQGPKVPAFERAVCNYTGVEYAVAVSNATAALHIACLALGVGPNDCVWTSPITFLASANCALYCGATVDFVDVDPATGNMSPNSLAEKLAYAKQQGCLPKVIIPVHLAGHSCDMQRIAELAYAYGVKVIEDASHGIGGSYGGSKLGCCRYSDITVFSFHPVKIITTAEGGMATTKDAALAEKMALLRAHGVVRDKALLTRPDEGDWYYEQQLLGFNYRMTELQAALGCSQMQRLDEFVKCRNQLAERYQQQLHALPLAIVSPLNDSYSARHLYIVRLPSEKRKAVFDNMRQLDIQVHVHYFPVHLQPYYQSLGFKIGDYPNAEQFYSEILTLPLFPGLKDDNIDFICNNLSALLSDN